MPNLAKYLGEGTSRGATGNRCSLYFFLSPQRIGLALILAATFALYAPALGYPFVYDDPFQIVMNPHLRSWRFLPAYFTGNVWSQLPDSVSNLYRPFFLVWLRLNLVLFGEQPAGWHLTTLLTHLLATALVYLLARRILKQDIAALVSAAIFALHPTHVEAVAWISGVTESLGAACFLAALLSYLQWRAGHRSRWLVCSLALFAAGMLAKETVAALPLVLVVYELTLGRNGPPAPSPERRSWTHWLLPYLVVLGVYLVGRRLAMGPLHPGEVSPKILLLSQPWLLWTYLRLLLWPAHLSASYDFAYVSRLDDLRFLLPLAGLAGTLILCWRLGDQLLRFLAGWFLITLAPALAAFCLAYSDECYHDRYLLLPSVALALAAGKVFARLSATPRRLQSGMAWGLAGLAIVGSGIVTHRLVPYWRDNYALFQRATAIAPRNQRATTNFVAELMKRREYQRARDLCAAMMRLYPDSPRPVEAAAEISLILKDYPAAENYFQRAAQLSPGEGKLYYLLGLARLDLHNYRGAAEALTRAIALSPKEAFFHYTLGTALARQGDWAAAREQFAAEVSLKANASQDLAAKAELEAEEHIRPVKHRVPEIVTASPGKHQPVPASLTK